MIVAAANFSLQKTSPEDYWRRFRYLTQQAAGQGADIILFPEYCSLPWVLAEGGNFHDRLRAAADLEARYVEEARRAAAEFRIAVIAGTYPHGEGEEVRNRSWICAPGKEPVYQDKLHLTRTEAEQWKLSAGSPELRLFRHAGALCAVAICYDVEFPVYCAAAAEAKVDVLFVPSLTSDVHGYWRVRHCAAARAVENQCFVALSSAVEGDSRYPEIGAQYGRAAILSPCEIGFPEAGVAAEAPANAEGIVLARAELRALQEIRHHGTVLNLEDSRLHRRVSCRE